MPLYPEPSRSPHNLSTEHCRWLYANGFQVPIVARSRRTVTVDVFRQRVTLKRSRLERDGFDTANGTRFSVSSYFAEQFAEQEGTP
jgi:hypothetical protein